MSQKLLAKKHIYMPRRHPTNSKETFVVLIFGFLAISIVATVFYSGEFDNYKLIIGLIGTYLGASILVIVIVRKGVIRDFKKRSTTTFASVIDRYFAEDLPSATYGGFTCYYVVMQFIALEKKWTFEAMVGSKLYNKTDRINKLTVTYANSDPRYFLLEGEY